VAVVYRGLLRVLDQHTIGLLSVSVSVKIIPKNRHFGYRTFSISAGLYYIWPTWPIYDPWLTHIWPIYDPIWPIYDPYMTHGWPIYDPYMTPCDPHMTHGWPIYDPWLTHMTHTWPHVTHMWLMVDPYMTHIWPIWHTGSILAGNWAKIAAKNLWELLHPCGNYWHFRN